MIVDRIRVTERGRRELIVLKRRTGLRTWNTLCRWAFCVSLADPGPPADVDLGALSSIEIPWTTFAGAHGDAYATLLRLRCRRDGIELSDAPMARALHLHLHRGISRLYAARDVRDIGDFIEVARRLA